MKKSNTEYDFFKKVSWQFNDKFKCIIMVHKFSIYIQYIPFYQPRHRINPNNISLFQRRICNINGEVNYMQILQINRILFYTFKGI